MFCYLLFLFGNSDFTASGGEESDHSNRKESQVHRRKIFSPQEELFLYDLTGQSSFEDYSTGLP
jgi:hypothetical protein